MYVRIDTAATIAEYQRCSKTRWLIDPMCFRTPLIHDKKRITVREQGETGMRALFVALALVMLPTAGLTWSKMAQAGDVLDRMAARGSVIAAAVPDTLPLAGRGKDGSLVGFDIEVTREIAKRLGLPVKFVTPAWETILGGSWGDAFDIAVASITPTEERARRIAFPATYRHDAAVMLVHKDNLSILQAADASGKVVGTKKDTTFEQYLNGRLQVLMLREPVKYLIANPQIKLYPDKEKAIAALAKGDGKEVDAVIMSFTPARTAIAAGAPARVIPGFLFFEPVAVAVDQGDPDLARAVERAVLEMASDGTLDGLSRKWFGTDANNGALGSAQ